MARSHGIGVGRGNGEGSRDTQFQPGMPSANAKGRPKNRKPQLPATIEEAISQALSAPVEMRIDNRRKTIPQIMAMIEVLLNEYPRTTVNQKIRTLQFMIGHAPHFSPRADVEENTDHIAKLVAWLVARESEEA